MYKTSVFYYLCITCLVNFIENYTMIEFVVQLNSLFSQKKL